MSRPPRLGANFFQRDPVTVAKALLGQRLVSRVASQTTAGLIVETEAYLGPEDQAAHCKNHHRSPRVESMYGPPGTAYVYFTYGMHHCLNLVTGPAGSPQAVLLRALEPTQGLDVMYRRRAKAKRDTDLCSGPAKLAQALAVTTDRFDGIDLTTDPQLFLQRMRQRAYPAAAIQSTPRVGVAYAGDWATKPLRFHLKGHPHVSKP